jgi:uncharacterized protein (TIGR02147 family)
MNIFEFDNYKEAMKLHIRNRQGASRGALKNMAEYLGVHPTLISQILSGSKDFSEEQIFSACEFLGLPVLETQYLWVLVQIERAGSVKLKKHYTEMREQLKKKAMQVSTRLETNRSLSEAEEATFYSSWLYSAIQVLTTLEQKVDFEYVCNYFRVSPSRAREILDFLTKIQMVREVEGRFLPGATSTHLGKQSPFIRKHHTNWRLKAIEACEELTDDELMYSGNFSISHKDFEKLREEMVQVLQKFAQLVKNSPGEDVAQFNLDLFWLK